VTFCETAFPIVDGIPQRHGPVLAYLRDATFSCERQRVWFQVDGNWVEAGPAIIGEYLVSEDSRGPDGMAHTIVLRANALIGAKVAE
jgi:hypothetical protein